MWFLKNYQEDTYFLLIPLTKHCVCSNTNLFKFTNLPIYPNPNQTHDCSFEGWLPRNMCIVCILPLIINLAHYSKADLVQSFQIKKCICFFQEFVFGITPSTLIYKRCRLNRIHYITRSYEYNLAHHSMKNQEDHKEMTM